MAGARYGSATVDRVIDLDPFVLPLGFLFPDATVDALRPYADALDGTHIDMAAGAVLLAVQSHVVRFAGKTILIDTCVGERKERPARADWHRREGTRYLAGLASCGCSPEDVDIVLCTHLHADHVGWNTRLDSGRWVPTFPKARYLIGKAELDHWQARVAAEPSVNHASFQDSVLPVIERGLATVTMAGDEIADGAKILDLAGHTPGQIGLEIAAARSETLVFCGDAIHTPAQVFVPEWSSAFCSSRQKSARTRRALLERAAGDGLRLVPAHLRAHSMHVRDRQGGFAPVFSM